MQLPGTLKTLTFGHEFNQSLEVELPEGLEELTVGHEFQGDLRPLSHLQEISCQGVLVSARKIGDWSSVRSTPWIRMFFFLKQKLVDLYPIGSMYGIYANIGGILMVNVTIYSIHGSYGYGSPHLNNFLEKWDFRTWDLQHLVPSFDHAYHTLLVGCLMVFFSFHCYKWEFPEMGDPQVTMVQ